MNDLYLRLGRLIAAQCPPGFDKAVLEADLHDGHPLLRIDTQADGEEVEVPLSDETVQRIEETLRAIQKAMAVEDPRPWNGCTVTLRKGGHFDLDIAYAGPQILAR